MIQIRHGMFETNSSSTHSLIICSEEEYKQFRRGELFACAESKTLLTIDEVVKKLQTDPCYRELPPLPSPVTPDSLAAYLEEHDLEWEITSWGDWREIELEHFEDHHTTKSGDKIVAFGVYGEHW